MSEIVFKSIAIEPNPVETNAQYNIIAQFEEENHYKGSILGIMLLGYAILGEERRGQTCILGNMVLGETILGFSFPE